MELKFRIDQIAYLEKTSKATLEMAVALRAAKKNNATNPFQVQTCVVKTAKLYRSQACKGREKKIQEFLLTCSLINYLRHHTSQKKTPKML